jgi:ATP-binding cassette subfamily B protein
VVLLPLGIVALRHYQGRLTVQTRTLRERSADLGSFLIESLLGMRLIVASGNERHEAERFRRLNASFVQSMLSMQITSFLASALPSSVLALSTALVFLYGGKLVIDGHLTVGGLVAFMAYHMRLLSPVQSLLGTYTNLLTGGVALSRVFEVLDAPVEVMESPDARPLADVRGTIVFIFDILRTSRSSIRFPFTFLPGRSASLWAPVVRENQPWPTCCCASMTPSREPSASTGMTCVIFGSTICADTSRW